MFNYRAAEQGSGSPQFERDGIQYSTCNTTLARQTLDYRKSLHMLPRQTYGTLRF